MHYCKDTVARQCTSVANVKHSLLNYDIKRVIYTGNFLHYISTPITSFARMELETKEEKEEVHQLWFI